MRLKSIRVGVRCSEQCTAGIVLDDPRVDVEDVTVRDLARRCDHDDHDPAWTRSMPRSGGHSRALRVRVRASDRAGNVSTATRSARITSG